MLHSSRSTDSCVGLVADYTASKTWHNSSFPQNKETQWIDIGDHQTSIS